MSLLQVNHVKRIYQTRFGSRKVEALKDIHFTVDEGEFVAIMGESGSGKTTLLNILATLDQPTAGTVLLNDTNIQSIPEKKLAAFRREHLGFVFQDFNLLDSLSAQDNIVLPLVLSNSLNGSAADAVSEVAATLGLSKHLSQYPYELSGGQQQRVAIARALITKPSILLADEPTGALDSKVSANILQIFENINAAGQTILMVTHSITAASRAGRVLFIKDGLLYHQLFRGHLTEREMFQKISDTLTMMTATTEGLPC